MNNVCVISFTFANSFTLHDEMKKKKKNYLLIIHEFHRSLFFYFNNTNDFIIYNYILLLNFTLK